MSGKLVTAILLVCFYLSSEATTGRTRYLLYSVNPGEGFNLRRDVHMRAASLVNQLREEEDWVLVLPPWPHLYHWKSRIEQSNVPWRRFFDVASLSRFVPSIEFEEYLEREGHVIEEVMYLQNFVEGWSGKFEEKLQDRPCINPPTFRQVTSGEWRGDVFGRNDVIVRSFRCVSAQGFASILVPELRQRKSQIRSVLVARFETLLHIHYGGIQYWAARKSMVYAEYLRDIGSDFMRDKLGYDPGRGNGRQKPMNEGGDFISVHARRRDYIHAHPDVVPSLEELANQINHLKSEVELEKVFLASDTPEKEKKQLQSLINGLVWYKPSKDTINHCGDGGVAIIDQWIASHAKYFIGTAASTFSFRIREDRQFMGFSKETTFNNLCGNEKDSCEEPTYWKLVEVPSLHEEL